MNCYYCSTPIVPDDPTVWRLVVGWDRPGQAGGSDIVLRTAARPAAFACPECVATVRATGNALQESLLDARGI